MPDQYPELPDRPRGRPRICRSVQPMRQPSPRGGATVRSSRTDALRLARASLAQRPGAEFGRASVAQRPGRGFRSLSEGAPATETKRVVAAVGAGRSSQSRGVIAARRVARVISRRVQVNAWRSSNCGAHRAHDVGRGRLAVPVGDVPRRTHADPRRQLGRGLAVVRRAAHVAELPGDDLPSRTVPRTGTREGVRHFVQQGLMVRIVVVARRQIPRDADAPVRVVAEPGAPLRVVERERPRRVEMGGDEGFGPVPYAVQFRHGCETRTYLRQSGRRHPPQLATDAAARRRSAASMARRTDSS